MDKPKYYIIEADALPDVFLRVAEAKRMLEVGEAATIHDATMAVDISRSAFYKYRDCISPFQNMMAGRIITFQLTLLDKAGILSLIMAVFAENGANILTVNQSIPSGSCAAVTISADTTELLCPVEDFLKQLCDQNGVVRAEIIAG